MDGAGDDLLKTFCLRLITSHISIRRIPSLLMPVLNGSFGKFESTKKLVCGSCIEVFGDAATDNASEMSSFIQTDKVNHIFEMPAVPSYLLI